MAAMELREIKDIVEKHSSRTLFGIPCANSACHNAIASSNHLEAIRKVKDAGWELLYVEGVSWADDSSIRCFCPACAKLVGTWSYNNHAKGSTVTLKEFIEYTCTIKLKVQVPLVSPDPGDHIRKVIVTDGIREVLYDAVDGLDLSWYRKDDGMKTTFRNIVVEG